MSNDGMNTNETTTNQPVTPGPWDIASLDGLTKDRAYAAYLNADDALKALRNTKPSEEAIIAYGNAAALKAGVPMRLDAAPAKAGGARGPKRESATEGEVYGAITKLITGDVTGVKTKAIEAACAGKSIGASIKKLVDGKRIVVKNLGKGAAGGNLFSLPAKAPEKASQREDKRK